MNSGDRLLRFRWLSIALLASLVISPQQVDDAEKIHLIVKGPLVFSLTGDSLETFARTGELTGNLGVASRVVDPRG